MQRKFSAERGSVEFEACAKHLDTLVPKSKTTIDPKLASVIWSPKVYTLVPKPSTTPRNKPELQVFGPSLGWPVGSSDAASSAARQGVEGPECPSLLTKLWGTKSQPPISHK